MDCHFDLQAELNPAVHAHAGLHLTSRRQCLLEERVCKDSYNEDKIPGSNRGGNDEQPAKDVSVTHFSHDHLTMPRGSREVIA